MSKEKLSSEQVPHKFSEWLLAMGCPPEDVPPEDKMTEMCRGQYYMVWRSVMERIGPNASIMNKRLQVFNNDVIKCKKKNALNELDVNMPNELHLCVQNLELNKQVADAEAKVQEKRDDLNQLMNKVSSKLAQRNLCRKRLEDAQRRSWLLQQASAELQERKIELLETKNIAESLCCLDESQDVESKIDKCVSVLSRPVPSRAGLSLHSMANPIANSSMASSASEDNDTEEHIASLVKCRGDIVFKQLFEKRAGLCTMSATNSDNEAKVKNRRTLQLALGHTAALHCTLVLEAVKNRAHIKQTNRQLVATLSELSKQLSGDACELLVVRCELAKTAARVNALKTLCDELKAGEGAFSAAPAQDAGNRDTSPASIHEMDKTILSKKEEVKHLIELYAAVERKTQNIRGNLVSLFNTFHVNGNEHFEGGSVSTTQGSISSLRQFYNERREKRQKKIELSMDLDVSENCSYNEHTDNGTPKFIDELRFYLKKFNLQKNRKLVLESGEKIWIFETVQSSLDQLYARWREDNVTTSVLCPSVSLAHNLARLAQTVMAKTELEAIVRFMEDGGKKYKSSLDISSTTEEELETLDKVKKRLNANILTHKKTGKTLIIVIDHLTLWSNNTVKDYISENRTVDGKTYKNYERAYLEFLRM